MWPWACYLPLCASFGSSVKRKITWSLLHIVAERLNIYVFISVNIRFGMFNVGEVFRPMQSDQSVLVWWRYWLRWWIRYVITAKVFGNWKPESPLTLWGPVDTDKSNYSFWVSFPHLQSGGNGTYCIGMFWRWNEITNFFFYFLTTLQHTAS